MTWRARAAGLAAIALASLPLAAGASARVPGVALPGPRVTSAARGRAGALSAATVREAQQLFRELGYPLGRERPGVLGVDTRGALSYFQRKYRLPVTGRPDASTLARMRAVAASLRGTPVARESSPHDLVEDVLGDGVPILGVAAALAALLGLLALSARARERPASRAVHRRELG